MSSFGVAMRQEGHLKNGKIIKLLILLMCNRVQANRRRKKHEENNFEYNLKP